VVSLPEISQQKIHVQPFATVQQILAVTRPSYTPETFGFNKVHFDYGSPLRKPKKTKTNSLAFSPQANYTD
jgi:hypothetical protein